MSSLPVSLSRLIQFPYKLPNNRWASPSLRNVAFTDKRARLLSATLPSLNNEMATCHYRWRWKKCMQDVFTVNHWHCMPQFKRVEEVHYDFTTYCPPPTLPPLPGQRQCRGKSPVDDKGNLSKSVHLSVHAFILLWLWFIMTQSADPSAALVAKIEKKWPKFRLEN